MSEELEMTIEEATIPGMESAFFADARATAIVAMEKVQKRLVELRQQRLDINAEIKALVADEELLARMVKVANGAKK